MTFITFFGGVNYTEMKHGNTYFEEIWGYYLILFLCVVERKAQIWLSNKFGFEGSSYDTFEGKIKLEMYGEDLTLNPQKSKL